MRSLYWKIFISFWLASIFIIIGIAWVTSHITQKSSQPAQEIAFMDSYANAAVATVELGQHQALEKWLARVGLSRHMSIFLLSSTGEIIGAEAPPENVKTASQYLVKNQLPTDIFKSGNLIVSHEILSTSGKFYRLAAISEEPISYYFQIPWTGLAISLTLAIILSGLICYLLSLYLTRPLRSLGLAAQSIATGKLSTRVGPIRGHTKNEIAKLSYEFDRMAEELEHLVTSKERLLQDISHELRSPLARLNIAIELGKNKADHLASAEFKRMQTETSRLNSLISEILEFARLEKSTTELNRDLCDLPHLLAEIIRDGNFECNESQERIVSSSIEPCKLNIDKRLIHRAIENVVRNALHYTPSDKRIHISLRIDNERQMVHIEVQDNGPGVPEEQLQKIFNPFYRVDSSRTKMT